MRKRWILLIVLAVLFIAAYIAFQVYVIGGAVTTGNVVVRDWSTDEIEDIPVAFDITPSGDVYVAETGQFSNGAGDNRQQAFWLPADMLSTSIDDRLAYVKAAISDGNLSEDWFDAKDTLRLIRDTDGDGKADSSRVITEMSGYIDGVMAGVLVMDDGLLVTNIPRVYRLRDNDGDEIFEESTVLSEGYGVRTAFVGHDLHGLVRGPDGKVYFSVGDRGFNVTTDDGRNLQAPMDQGRGGVFRMEPDGSELELYSWGFRNPQELAFDNYGNLVTGDNNSDGGDKARILYVVEGGDYGWTYGYQYMAEEEYLRGPWNAEKMWEPYHAGQPAWIMPPLANETNGPSGLAFYPGLGLSDKYQGHFFLSNYSFMATASWMLSFALEPEGAGFTLRNVHKFASDDLFIDQTFGYDGKMYSIIAGIFPGPKKILQLYDPDQQDDPRIAEARELLIAGLDQLSTPRLLELLGHADQRLRLQAQFELASRKVVAELTATARNTTFSEMTRIHALWGLGQLGPEGFADWQDFNGFDAELLAQLLKSIGEAKVTLLAPLVREQLSNDNARVRYFAAMAAGHAKDQAAVGGLALLLAQNDNEDAFVRHAAVWALTNIVEPDALKALAKHESAAVRLGALLVARRLQSPLLAEFLQDSDASLVVEASRAIHDLRLEGQLPALAALASTELPIQSDDPQSSFALHRRVINANLLVGGAEQAMALGRYAESEKNPTSMRTLALQTLEEFAEPPVADKVWGDHKQFSAREASVVHEALDQSLPALMESPLREQALQLALKYERVPLDGAELAAMVANKTLAAEQRVGALQALVGQPQSRTDFLTSLDVARNSQQAKLRAAALTILADQDPEEATTLAVAVAERAEADLAERQSAISTLGKLNTKAASVFLLAQLAKLSSGELQPEVQLDVFNAAAQSANGEINRKFLEFQQQQTASGPLQARRIAMFGGNTQLGKKVFENSGDCLRCHSVAQRGGVAGPALDGVASRYDSDYLFRSLLEPSADLAPGFASVALTLQDGNSMAGIMLNETADIIRLQQDGGHGDVSEIDININEVQSRNGPFSGMPAMGLVLAHDDLRDLMAYVQSLR